MYPSLGCAKFHVNRCNESPLRGENTDFRLVSKFNTGSLPLRGKSYRIKHANTTFSHIHTASARCSISSELCMVVEDVDSIQKVANPFNLTHSFSYRVHGNFFG